MGMLVAFAGPADSVAAWVVTPEEARRWAGVTTWPVPVEVFAAWHAEPGVVPFLLVEDEQPVAYGELWDDGPDAELGRLLVDPGQRGRGVGRQLVEALVAEAHRRGFDEIWLRVLPENEQARRCYTAAGFVRASLAEETAFNTNQPREFVWMRHAS